MQILPQKEGAYFRMRLTDKVKDAQKNKFYGSRYSYYLGNIYRLIFSNYLISKKFSCLLAILQYNPSGSRIPTDMIPPAAKYTDDNA